VRTKGEHGHALNDTDIQEKVSEQEEPPRFDGWHDMDVADSSGMVSSHPIRRSGPKKNPSPSAFRLSKGKISTLRFQ
jgi:hypothetical protein